MNYSNLTPVIVPSSMTLGDLRDMARFNGWSHYRYDARRGVLYAETQESEILLRGDAELYERLVSRIDAVLGEPA